ncbi:MmcQ/YjbR family DNA-binding protein [Pectinatus haikarae]|uniref:MmcQ/YjbR family DNA-binding protein n=1 Tax=Pectinatus haikarae TaxID=349096 RepID=UPI0018C5912E
MIFERDDNLYINLKCEPQYIDEIRESNKDILPGFHMNKRYWNTVKVNGDVSEKELFEMIEHSYALTLKR